MKDFINIHEEKLVDIIGTWIGRLIKWGGHLFLIIITRGFWILAMVFIESILALKRYDWNTFLGRGEKDES